MTMISSPEAGARAVTFLEQLFAEAPLENVAFQLWDGTHWPDDRPRAATLWLKRPESLELMFGAANEAGLAEAYLHDAFDVLGDMESALELAESLNARGHEGLLQLVRGIFHLQRLRAVAPRARRSGLWRTLTGAPHSRTTDRQAIAFHYDVSNDFFQLWLDPRMIYSCGYFEHARQELAAAQEAKLRHLGRKLRLKRGQHVLDIGCGWGGLAIFFAQEFGVRVHGVTLSREQASLAAARVRDAGLEGTVTIELRDYRDVTGAGTYDAIVSVGMSEHVGRTRLPFYFRHVAHLLKPGGVFLNHAIGEGVRPRVTHGPSFIQEYVFPDSDIPPLPVVVGAGEAAELEIRDVENLREHYRLTLRHWVTRLEAAHESARSFVSEETYRVWRLYMAASARGFDRGHLAIYQVLFAKPDAAGNAGLPLTRDDWYRGASAPTGAASSANAAWSADGYGRRLG